METWQQQFYCAPRDQRISFLYLANDILQNSRWKGLEFIDEFWKVIPGALSDVFNNGGEIGRSTVVRLVRNIELYIDIYIFLSCLKSLSLTLLYYDIMFIICSQFLFTFF